MRGERQTVIVAYHSASGAYESFQVGGEMPVFRGSPRHVLYRTSTQAFQDELFALVTPISCRRAPGSVWMPQGRTSGSEAPLETFGPRSYPDHPAWRTLKDWWLVHPARANTPNWDIAVACEIEGRPGLLLVEAKANVPELGVAGKPLTAKDPASTNSKANYERSGSSQRSAFHRSFGILDSRGRGHSGRWDAVRE
jgi:hypothetical protein